MNTNKLKLKRAANSAASIAMRLTLVKDYCAENDTETALKMKERVIAMVTEYCDNYIAQSIAVDIAKSSQDKLPLGEA